MAKKIGLTEVAKIVRGELKKHFPGVKFSVRSKSYSGGCSIRVNWTDGPTEAQVAAIAGDYHGASFDGMIDLKEYHLSQYQGETVSFENDYIFFDRDHSDAALQAAVEWYRERHPGATVEIMPSRKLITYTASAYVVTPDFQVQDEIYRHMRATPL